MKKSPTPNELLVAIHRHCLACSGGSRKEVHNCTMKNCALHPYREPETSRKPRKIKGQISVFELTGGGIAHDGYYLPRSGQAIGPHRGVRGQKKKSPMICSSISN